MVTTASALDRCGVCGGPCRTGFACCYCCRTLVRQLGQPLVRVSAMADYRVGDGMHRHLRGYKDAPLAEVRRAHVEALGSMASRWLDAHRGELVRRFGAPWDAVATVPSTSRRRGAPVDAVVGQVDELRELHRSLLVRGDDPVDHLVASRHGFDRSPSVDPSWLRGRSVLVVDDSHVTGARAQSAVAALRAGGAEVVGIVVLGRVVGGADRRV